MAETQRNKLGLFVIALRLGAAPAMLWLGRWKLALAYAVAGAALVMAFFAANAVGPPWPAWWNSRIELDALIPILSLAFSVAAFVHALWVNGLAMHRPWYSHWYVALVLPAVVALPIAFAVRTCLYQPFNAPSESSFPNLLAGDSFFISKSAYRRRDPQRGDVAVFKLPGDPHIDYVKRVVGLPGGQSYVIADIGETKADNTQEYVVPEGHYFTLGDNRDNSQDSRRIDAVGYIPRGNFVGPFAFRFWNSNAVPLRLRPRETYRNAD